MCKTQFLRYFSEESCKGCSSIQKADKCVEFDECSSSSFEYFKAGYSAHQKECEEKLRWISVDDYLPEQNKTVLAKDSGGYYFVAHISIHGWVNNERGEYVSSKFGRILTHWRPIL